MVALALMSASLHAEDRPKLKLLSDKKLVKMEVGSHCQEKKGKWGYADWEDKFIISPIFDAVQPFNQRGQAFVAYRENENGPLMWTVIDKIGMYLTEENFDTYSEFDEVGLALVCQSGRVGMIDYSGKMVVGCKYDRCIELGAAYLFHDEADGVVLVAKGTMDKQYQVETYPVGDDVVVCAGGRYGILSTANLKMLMPFEYESIAVQADGKSYVLARKSARYLYTNGVLSDAYDKVEACSGCRYFIVHDSNGYGVVIPSGEVILPCSQKVTPVLGDEYHAYYTSKGMVYINADGKISVSGYDDVLYGRLSPVKYVMDTTLPDESKKYLTDSFDKIFATKDFAKVAEKKYAQEYVAGKRLFALGKSTENGQVYDIDKRTYIGIPAVVAGGMCDDGRPLVIVCNGDETELMDVSTLEMVLPSMAEDAAAEVSMTTVDGEVYEVVKRNYQYGLYDSTQKKQVLDYDYDEISLHGRYALLKQHYFYWIYDISAGKRVLSDTWLQSVSFVDDDKVALMCGTSCGVYDLSASSWVLNLKQYDNINGIELMGNYIKVSADDKVDVYDVRSGECLFSQTYVEVDLLHGTDLIRFYKYFKAGLYDLSHGKVVLEAKYSPAVYYSNYQLMELSPDDKSYGLYDLLNKCWTFEPGKYKAELVFAGGDLLCKEGNVLKIFDSETRTFRSVSDVFGIPFECETLDLSKKEDGWIAVRTGGKWGLFSIVEKQLEVPCEYDCICPLFK